MEQQLLTKYLLQYDELHRQFLNEVEQGTDWGELKPLMVEMKKLDAFIDSLSNSPVIDTRSDNSSPTER